MNIYEIEFYPLVIVMFLNSVLAFFLNKDINIEIFPIFLFFFLTLCMFSYMCIIVYIFFFLCKQLFLGRQQFDACMSICRRQDGSGDWKSVMYLFRILLLYGYHTFPHTHFIWQLYFSAYAFYTAVILSNISFH